jgi:hypothetical protein
MLDLTKKIAAVIALLAIFAFYGWQEYLISQQPPKAHEENKGAAASKYKPNPLQPFRLFTSNGLKEITAYCNSHSEQEKKNWPQTYFCDLKITDFYIAFFSGLLVLVTGGLVWTGIQQYRDTRILQRAYLSIEPRGVSPGINNPSVELVGHIGIRNTGRLPATNVSWTTKIEYSSEEHRESFPDLSVWHGGTHQIAAGSIMTQTGAPITFGSSDRYLYVWGNVRYLDGFGKKRSTRYCHRYNTGRFPRDPTVKRRIRPRYGRYHEHGNYSDTN